MKKPVLDESQLLPPILMATRLIRLRKNLRRSWRIPGLSLFRIRRLRRTRGKAVGYFPAMPWSAGWALHLFWGNFGGLEKPGAAPPHGAAYRPGIFESESVTGTETRPIAARSPNLVMPARNDASLSRADVAMEIPATTPGRSAITQARRTFIEGVASLASISPTLALIRTSLGPRGNHHAAVAVSTVGRPRRRAAGHHTLPGVRFIWLNSAARSGLARTARPPATIVSRNTQLSPELAAVRRARASNTDARTEPSDSPAPSAAFPDQMGAGLPYDSRSDMPSLVWADQATANTATQASGMTPGANSETAVSIPWPWGEPAIRQGFVRGGRGHQAQDHALPARTASAAATSSILAIAETMRTFVRTEMENVKAAVTRIVNQKPEAPRQDAALDHAVARQMLSRLRAIMQEERFREGNLR